jgi:hypothetical protein
MGGQDTAAVRLARLTTKLPPGLQRAIAKVPPATQRKIVRVAPYAAIAIVGLVIGFAVRGKPKAPPPVVSAAAPAAVRELPVVEPAPPPETKTAPPPASAAPAARVEPPVAKKKVPVAEEPAAEKPPQAAAAERPEKVAAAEKPEKIAAAEKPEKVAPAEKPTAPPKVAAAASPAPAEKPAPATEAEAPPPAAAGSGTCTAHVVTEPKDVKVVWGGKLIGNTPLASARVPCGPATVSLERDRWQVVTVDVNAEPGAAASVHERLRRPRGTIDVSSTPPGAQISVNRIAAGAAPKQIDVQRYEKIQIKATLKGYQPWTKTVYLKDPESKIDIQLVARK